MSRWDQVRGRLGTARRAANDRSDVLLAAVHDGRTLDVVVAAPPVARDESLVLTRGGEAVAVRAQEVGDGRARFVVDAVDALAAGRWSVGLRDAAGAERPLLHQVSERRDGRARAADGPLSALVTRFARLGGGVDGALVVEVVEAEDAAIGAVVVDLAATSDGVRLALAGAVSDGEPIVAEHDAHPEVKVGTVTDGAARCALLRVPVLSDQPTSWRLVVGGDAGRRPLRFHVADLGRPGAAVKFPALEVDDGAGIVRRRPVLGPSGALAVDVRVQREDVS